MSNSKELIQKLEIEVAIMPNCLKKRILDFANNELRVIDAHIEERLQQKLMGEDIGGEEEAFKLAREVMAIDQLVKTAFALPDA